MKFLFFVFLFCLGGLWGYLQHCTFPREQFGILSYFTSLIGGFLIGYFGVKVFKKFYK